MALTVAEIDAAITSILEGGQSVTVDGFTYTAANLPALRELRESVAGQESRINGNRPTFRAHNFGSMGY